MFCFIESTSTLRLSDLTEPFCFLSVSLHLCSWIAWFSSLYYSRAWSAIITVLSYCFKNRLASNKICGNEIFTVMIPSLNLPMGKKEQVREVIFLPGLYFSLNYKEKLRACLHLPLFSCLVKKKKFIAKVCISYCCRTKSLSS